MKAEVKKKLMWSSIIVLIVGIGGCARYVKEEGQASTKDQVSLNNRDKKEIAMELVSSAENSSLKWQDQYAYIEDIQDGRGYTAGIIGFCSGTGDMLELVKTYTKHQSDNELAQFLPALEKVNGSASHDGLGVEFEAAWKAAAKDKGFQQAQDEIRDRIYFNPGVKQAQEDGLSTLGQFIYYDGMVMHGPGDGSVPMAESFPGIREAALRLSKTPAEGGDERVYLTGFLDERAKIMGLEDAHEDLSRIEAQRQFLKAGNMELETPLKWKMYGEPFEIK
ncbi:chitosanase [uncultured Vagococcus sp.]|uniref:chitosanase n=1 Tax=uncultured Vagococcus sp. TaxID=189676 RepID=UPI0028D6667E|nr:chitosanase [uncultured Vagococcus sp.]